MQKKRQFILILPIVAGISLNVYSAEAFSRNDPIIESQPSQWLASPPFVRVGTQKAEPIWAWVEAPAAVVRAASKELNSQPRDWSVSNILDWHENWPRKEVHRKDHIVTFTSGADSFTCLVTPKAWIHLNETASIPVINQIASETAISVTDLKSLGKLTTYLEDVANLYRGSSRLVLHKKFYGGKPSDAEGWLDGKEKSFEVFRSLRYDPIVIVNKSKFKITCNMISMGGSVETWIFVGYFKGLAHISGITISQIRPPGTFSWPLAD